MSTRLSHRTTGRRVVITVASSVLMAGAVSGIAAADPPGLNRDACAVAIAPAGVWPGTVDIGHQYRLVSDAYGSYLAQQPECSPDLATR